MAVISCDEIHDGRSGDAVAWKKGVRKHTRRFRVVTNNRYDGSYTVLASLPSPGSIHPEDSWCVAISAKANQDAKSKLVWIASVEYSSEPCTPDGQKGENPLADPADIDWNTDTTQEPFWKDKNDDAVLNSAGDYYEDMLVDDVSRWTVNISKNLGYVPAWIDSYRDAVNTDNIMIDGLPVAAGTAKIKSIQISKWQSRNDVWYRVFQLTIKIKDDWRHYPLDMGLRCKDPDAATKRIACVDDNKRPVTKPVHLNGSGAQLANPTPSTAVFNTVDKRNLQSFASLPLN